MDNNTQISKETVEQAIEFILEEGRCQGYQEAMKVYGKQYKEIINKGRTQGIIVGALLCIGSFIGYKYYKKKQDDKERDKVINVHPSDVEVEKSDCSFEEFEV